HVSYPRTRNFDWQHELDYMLATYFRDRHALVLDQWRAANLYPQTDAPEFLVDGQRQHGGEVGAMAPITFANSNSGAQGTIYYTTDGSDPRMTGGAVNTASAAVFTSAIQPPEGDTHLKARILRNGEWSALTDAVFTVAAPLADNADFNNDGLVDAGDYPLWRDNLGNTGTAGLLGDANHDGVVDTGDYQVWRLQYGSPPPALVAAPSSITLAISDSGAAQALEAQDANLNLREESSRTLTTSLVEAADPISFRIAAGRSPRHDAASLGDAKTSTHRLVTLLLETQLRGRRDRNSVGQEAFDESVEAWDAEPVDFGPEHLDAAIADWSRFSPEFE
ncbi:MAG: chitobiase/beta-hexosaminidase C-terminal domain-containing protein, partial [Planctomycetales bacterium]|nr:chitobiase/beta-hexosaminidase C-terminal domain-containing protein [Planctomycetales bacterium]